MQKYYWENQRENGEAVTIMKENRREPMTRR